MKFPRITIFRVIMTVGILVTLVGLYAVGSLLVNKYWVVSKPNPVAVSDLGKATTPSVYQVYVEFIGHIGERRSLQATASYNPYFPHYSATGLGYLEPVRAFSNGKPLVRQPNEKWFRRDDSISATFELPKNGKLQVEFMNFASNDILTATWTVDGENLFGPLEAPELDNVINNRDDFKLDSLVEDGIYKGSLTSQSGVTRFITDIMLHAGDGSSGYGVFTEEIPGGFKFNTDTKVPQGVYILKVDLAIPNRKDGGKPSKSYVPIYQKITTIVTDK